MLLENQPSTRQRASETELPTELQAVKSSAIRSTPSSSKSKRFSLTSKLQRGWQNLPLQSKLVIMLLVTTGVPLLVVTQALLRVASDNLLSDLRASLQEKNTLFTEEYVLWTKEESKLDADTITTAVQDAQIDLSNPQEVLQRSAFLQNLLKIKNDVEPESVKSFKIITDAQGRSIAHNAQVLAEDFALKSPLPATGAPPITREYKSVPLASGTALGTIPIVKNAIATGQALDGMELLKEDSLQLLGVTQQANIGIRPQSIQGLPEPKQPASEGTYDIDRGKAGLVSVAVYPIKVKGKLVGTAIVGSLINRNYGLVDKFTSQYNVPVATVFAQDWRITTNVPYIDPTTKSPDNTRALGTRVSREVAEIVLNQGKDFIGEANIVGAGYLTAYRPLYDHQKLINPQAKPVGIAFIGRPLAEVQGRLSDLEKIGYGIGLFSLTLAGVVGVLFASTLVKPVRRLAQFTQQIGDGEIGIRLEDLDRNDEIGILSQELNKMAASIDLNLEDRRQETKRTKLYADIASALTVQIQDLENVFDRAVQGAREVMNADRVVIYRFNLDWSGYLSHESVEDNLPSALAEKATDPCIPQTLIEAYRQGRVVPTDDMQDRDYHPDHRALLARLQIKANLVVPISQQGQLFGLLVAHHCTQTHAWQQDEIDFLKQIAVQIGLSLDRVGLLGQIQESRQQSEVLATDQRQEKETLQRRALELLVEVDPVSKGDLTIRANVTADEIGTIADSYNAMIRSLRQIVTQVQTSAQSVSDTAESSETTIESLSTETSRQVVAITAALQQIQVMAESSQGVSNRAQQATQKVQQSAQAAQAGDAAMNSTVEGIMAIRNTVSTASKKVKRLGEASENISKVVKLIANFAAQTNLLALNAAIEAARAGEEGEGFAVVARKVRDLAQQSAKATVEISELVEEIQSQTNEVIAAMESGTEQVEVGTLLVAEARQKINQINTVSTEINKLVQEIAKAAAIQTQSSTTAAKNMQDVASIANSTSEQSESVASSFAELIQVAQALQVTVAQFKVA